jgi:hypothetical protein
MADVSASFRQIQEYFRSSRPCDGASVRSSYDSTFPAHSNFWLLLFIYNSIAIQMVLRQQDAIIRFSPVYWVLVLPALLIPLRFTGQIVEVFKGRGRALLVFLICAGGFHLVRGDFRTVLQLFLLVWVMAWCACDTVRISTSDVVKVELSWRKDTKQVLAGDLCQ